MARNQINYSSKKEKSSWDSNRLIREYVGIAWMLNFSEQLEDLSWDNQVRVRRVASPDFINASPKLGIAVR